MKRSDQSQSLRHIERYLLYPASASGGNRRMLLLVLGISLAAALLLAAVGINVPLMLSLALVVLFSLLLAARGVLLLAGLLPTSVGFAIFTYLIYHNHGLRDTAVLGLPALIIAASLMTGRLGSLLFGSLSLLAVLGLWLGESRGWISYAAPTTNRPADYLAVSLALMLITALQWAVLRRLDNTIRRVQEELAERQRAAQAFSESEARYRFLVTEAPLGILILSPAGLIEQANPAALSLLGYRPDELMGSDPRQLIDRSGPARVGLDVAELRSGKTLQLEHVLLCKNGASIPVMGSTKQMPDGRFQYIFQDMRARKEAEAAIQSLNEVLEQRVQERTVQLRLANQELESFAYTVSHDLRAPLRAVNGYAALLADELQAYPPGEAQVFLSNIRASALRMDELISALLQFSRLSRTHVELALVNCKALVESLLPDLVQPGRAIQWCIYDSPPCLADPALLRQVYANLIGNAIKYSAPRPEAVIELGGYREEQVVVYYVKDNGVGFEMQHAEKIFGVFQRLHGPDEFEGAGIGLAIVKRIVERHAGRVWCDAQPGVGATFFFTIPVNEGAEEQVGG